MTDPEWTIARLTLPAVEPVTLAEAKAHMRVETAADDALITALIVEAREWSEDFCNRAFITQTWQVSSTAVPGTSQIYLARPPLIDVASVIYLAPDGTQVTLDPSAYDVDNQHEPGYVVPLWGTSWPAMQGGPKAIRVKYTAGYGDTADLVPQGIKQGIMARVAMNYEARGDIAVGAGAVAPVGPDPAAILQRFKSYWIA
jgi:uncharacterized phiE125 gp8 family phage protein